MYYKYDMIFGLDDLLIRPVILFMRGKLGYILSSVKLSLRVYLFKTT